MPATDPSSITAKWRMWWRFIRATHSSMCIEEVTEIRLVVMISDTRVCFEDLSLRMTLRV